VKRLYPSHCPHFCLSPLPATLPLGFRTKDLLFLAVSFYLLKRDLVSAASELGSTSDAMEEGHTRPP